MDNSDIIRAATAGISQLLGAIEAATDGDRDNAIARVEASGLKFDEFIANWDAAKQPEEG